MAKSELKKAKGKAWRAFSKYIRLRDAVITTGGTECAICCTCRKQYPVEKLHAGHFLPGRTNGILFDERGVHAQCVGCNIYGGGRQAEYHLYMVEKYGHEVIDELARNKVQSCKIHQWEYEALTKEYRRRADTIMANGMVESAWSEPFLDVLRRIQE
jgi:hypothetical protein